MIENVIDGSPDPADRRWTRDHFVVLALDLGTRTEADAIALLHYALGELVSPVMAGCRSTARPKGRKRPQERTVSVSHVSIAHSPLKSPCPPVSGAIPPPGPVCPE